MAGARLALALLRKLMPCRRNHYSAVQTSPGKHGASQTLGSDERESMLRGNGTVTATAEDRGGEVALTVVCVILKLGEAGDMFGD